MSNISFVFWAMEFQEKNAFEIYWPLTAILWIIRQLSDINAIVLETSRLTITDRRGCGNQFAIWKWQSYLPMNHQNMHHLLNNRSSIQNSNYAKEIPFKSKYPPSEIRQIVKAWCLLTWIQESWNCSLICLSDKSQ